MGPTTYNRKETYKMENQEIEGVRKSLFCAGAEIARSVATLRRMATPALPDEVLHEMDKAASGLVEQACAIVEMMRYRYGSTQKPGTITRQVRRALGYTYP